MYTRQTQTQVNGRTQSHCGWLNTYLQRTPPVFVTNPKDKPNTTVPTIEVLHKKSHPKVKDVDYYLLRRFE